MKNKSIYVLALLFLVCILSISAINGTENTSNKNVVNTDNDKNILETNNQYDDVSTSKDNCELNLETNNDNEQCNSKKDKTTTVNENPLTFSDLNKTINDNSNSTIYLSTNYTFYGDLDHDFPDGIPINRNLTIYGAGVTLDGSSMARIFYVSNLNLSVNFYNINFINAFQANSGGAIYGGNAYNCTFTTNNAEEDGGAIHEGNAYNCTFTQNVATIYGGAIHEGDAYNCIFTQNSGGYGGAMRNGNAYNCTFTNNTADVGGAMYKGEAVLCIFTNNDYEQTTIIPATINALEYTSSYQSGGRLKFNLTAKDRIFDGFNTTINIYKDNVVYTTVYGLTGEGWIVDLEPGEYIAELSLPLYPEVTPINTTINVSKANTTVEISPITNVILGKEITINYTTNSNGTVTIKVNGQEITDGKFTPTKEGIYNVTIETAENDYYTKATNQTTFTAKLASKITANPVSTIYNVDKNLVVTLKDQNGKTINKAVLTVNLDGSKKYTTDSNGQVKINVATLAPKTYNAKIKYEGSDLYSNSTASVKVTVKKATPKITAKSTSYKLKVKTKKYTVNFKDNKNHPLKSTKVTLKVNGKTYSVKTNSKGQATFKITNLKKKGRYTGLITVPANTYYNKISKKVIIAVKQ
ncbi:hypothetical protein [uncultured Methanobrevibacter sp.]|uniref:hypothetical protein n=1 Tax=uncultured Methanobrevibacter sp. TaxID=253161 RepID=UPI0025E5558D|nr:hypothetical protein [uncultured Methanobrevibacter sp.]